MWYIDAKYLCNQYWNNSSDARYYYTGEIQVITMYILVIDTYRYNLHTLIISMNKNYNAHIKWEWHNINRTEFL